MDPIGSAVWTHPSTEDGTMAGDSETLTRENDNKSLMELLAGTQEERIDLGSGSTGRRMITSPNSQDWEAYRPIITHYYKHYKGRGLPLRAVRSIMDLRYGFIASARMYKQRIKTWGLPKNHRRNSTQILREDESSLSNRRLSQTLGQAFDMREMPRQVSGSQPEGRRRGRSTSSTSFISSKMPEEVHSYFSSNVMPEEVDAPFFSNTVPEEVDLSFFSSTPSYSQIHNDVEKTLMSLIFTQPIAAPDQDRYLQDILNNVDEYCRSCFRNQGRLFTTPVFGSVGVSFKDVNDDYADMGLLKVHDAGYAAMGLAKAHQYREARILLGEAQDKVKNLLKAQHPTLLPYILEIICENSTTPEFNVSEWFHQYVVDLCAIIMREQPSLTTILQLLSRVDFKLETCAMILSRIQAILGAEFGATQWQARRPVKVFCRVLRHLGRYDEVEKILPTTVGTYGSLEEPTQSESLGLLYEWAWLSARGRHDTTAAAEHFEEILRRTDRDARRGEISHFRLKALRGLGILAREKSRHDLSERYFSAALRESKQGRFDRRDSNTVRIASELEESLRKLGRLEEADELRREREELFWEKDEAVEVWKAMRARFSVNGATGFVLGDEEAVSFEA